jgi:aldehyde dehydrogenase (NAD(P)+)
MSTLSATASSNAATEPTALERALADVKAKATEFARLPPLAKAALARECVAGLRAQAAAWAARGAEMRDADPGEEWLAGPVPSIRLFRLFAESLEQIAQHGRPGLGHGARRRRDGRIEVELFPNSMFDKLSFAGFSGYALMDAGVNEQQARERQAAFYQQKDPTGGVSVILGAGNVSSIPAMDVASKMFGEGFVCVLKMNPVNEWVGPFVEQALAPLVSRGYLRIVYGGAEVGSALVYHPLVDDVHITGSDRTHDLIVWGPPGPERDRRKAENDPLLRVPITSELGNVSPVAIVPYHYSDDELWFQARNVASMVVNNASFNCNAAKMLITPRGWAQREAFLALLGKALVAVPPRRAYYPARSIAIACCSTGTRRSASAKATASRLPWALVRGLDRRTAPSGCSTRSRSAES